MKILSTETDFLKLGKPSAYLSTGLSRRLDLVQDTISFRSKKILDLGCGVGAFLREFTKYTSAENVFGSEYDSSLFSSTYSVDSEFFKETKIPVNNIHNCAGEDLDFPDGMFDIVFMNEVLEHVQNDEKVISEIYRVLKPDGIWINFTPNRLWPFEQHGIVIGKKFIWGNIPLVPYLPRDIYKKLCPYVTSYSESELKNKIKKSGNFEIEVFTQIYPGFDGLKRRFGKFGKYIQDIVQRLESTPLRIFGISHMTIVRKVVAI